MCQSLSKIQDELADQAGIELSRETIRRLLGEWKIRPKSNVKRLHPNPHPERDRQFQYIHDQRAAFEKAGWPCISVDTKKKELLGRFYNSGTKWCREATAVNTHDFPSYAEGRVMPYGIYDVRHNLGYVAVGQSADTPEFAVDSILWWWRTSGGGGPLVLRFILTPLKCSFWPMVGGAMAIALAAGKNNCKSSWLTTWDSPLLSAIIPLALPNGIPLSTGCLAR